MIVYNGVGTNVHYDWYFRNLFTKIDCTVNTNTTPRFTVCLFFDNQINIRLKKKNKRDGTKEGHLTYTWSGLSLQWLTGKQVVIATMSITM